MLTSAQRLILLLGMYSVSYAGFTAEGTFDPGAIASEVWRQAKAGQAPVLGLALFDKGQTVHEAVYTQAQPLLSVDTPFRWGSITKTFTALTMLKLAEQGALSLNDPLTKHLTAAHRSLAFNNPFPQRLRVHHLLELSAGLGDLSGIEWESAKPLSLNHALALNPSNRTLRWPAGLQHSYSNAPPGLSALVIEQLSDKTFAEQLETLVLQPMGLTEASLQPLPRLPGGFKADGHTPIPYWHMTYPAFGALNASVKQLQQLPLALLNNGVVDGKSRLSDFQLRYMRRPHTGLSAQGGAQGGLAIGYAAGIYARIRQGLVWWGHGGDADGYRSRYAVHYPSGRGYLIVINSDNAPLLRRLEATIEQSQAQPWVSKAATRPVLKDQSDLTQTDLDQYVGHYYPSSTRFQMDRWQGGQLPWISLSTSNGKLELRRHGASKAPMQLLAVTENQFRRASDPVATLMFVRDTEGFMNLQGELGNYVRIQRAKCPGYFKRCPQRPN